MKKFIVFAVALALMMLPAAAFAKAEFSLGGYIKLDTFWDSSQNNWAMFAPVARDNTVQGTHGRFSMRAAETRFNFTIKGPKFMGAVVTGFIEMDFDTSDYQASPAGAYLARVRHAMFRLDWPETELLLGQYWGLFDNYIPDSAQDGQFIPYTTAFDRIAQLRLTQKFAGDWQVAGLIGLPTGINLTSANPYGNASNGMAAETPQVQGMIKYSHDWWGKAAYFGHPIPFTASVSAGWQRNVSRRINNVNVPITGFGIGALGENGYFAAAPAGSIVSQKYVSPWMVKAGMFIPVLPTHTANLANTASLMTSWFIGQGVEAFGMFGVASNVYKLQYIDALGRFVYEPSLLKRFGGFAQANYYFTNEWYANVAYGITRCFGVSQNNNLGTNDAFSADEMRTMQEVDATLWYRPIQALKFGVQYTYANSNYFQKTSATAGSTLSDKGHEHRVEVVGIFYF